jgi:hypothetical protein
VIDCYDLFLYGSTMPSVKLQRSFGGGVERAVSMHQHPSIGPSVRVDRIANGKTTIFICEGLRKDRPKIGAPSCLLVTFHFNKWRYPQKPVRVL